MQSADRKFLELLPTLGEFRSVIGLNGRLPSRMLVEQLTSQFQLPLIAVDGAYDQLRKIGFHPDVLIGDLDSVQTIGKGSFDVHPNALATLSVIKIEDQDTSDFQKAYHYASEQRLLPAIVLGLNGGFFDHSLHNTELFMEMEAIAYDCPLLILTFTGTKIFHFEENTKLSLFGAPVGRIYSKGLRWELQDYLLSFGKSSSSFNRCEMDVQKLTVTGGKALLAVYLSSVIDAGAIV